MQACEKANISRQTYYDWRNADPKFAAECDEVIHYVHDFVESKLLKHINEGDLKAIMYYCSRKMKHRGYGEDQQVLQVIDNTSRDSVTEKEREILDRYVADRMKYIEAEAESQSN